MYSPRRVLSTEGKQNEAHRNISESPAKADVPPKQMLPTEDRHNEEHGTISGSAAEADILIITLRVYPVSASTGLRLCRRK